MRSFFLWWKQVKALIKTNVTILFLNTGGCWGPIFLSSILNLSFCENVSKKLLDYILQVFFQIHVVGLSLQFEQFLFCLDKHKWAKAWSQRTCLAHSVVIVFRYVENLNVNGEYHQKSLSKSDSKTKQTEKYQAIENLDVIDSTSVHWRTGQPRFQSIIFCSSWPKFSSQIGTLNGNYLWKILPLQKLELKFPQFSFH